MNERGTAQPEKTALITSGGGMKCAYSGGAVVALARELGFESPDIYIAASGSVAAMFYALAGQYDDIERAWTRFLPSSAFIKYAPLPSMRIDYLVDTIFKTYLPLNIDKFNATNTQYFVPLTDHATGKVHFISNDTVFNPYEIMRAAKAIPLLYNQAVRLGGRKYLDGDLSTSTESLIQKAIEAGATKILCVVNGNVRTKTGDLIVRTYARTLPPPLRAAVLQDLLPTTPCDIPEGITLVTVNPGHPLPAKLYSRSTRKIKETYHLGYEDTRDKREEILQLFNSSRAAISA